MEYKPFVLHVILTCFFIPSTKRMKPFLMNQEEGEFSYKFIGFAGIEEEESLSEQAR